MAGGKMLKPVGRRILIQTLEPEVKQTNIIIPDTVQKEPERAIVIAVAEVKKDDDPFPVKEGDNIIFGKYGGVKIEFEEEEYILLSEDDILAVIEEEIDDLPF